MLKPELDAAVFGDEGVNFSLRGSAFMFFFSFGCEVSRPDRML